MTSCGYLSFGSVTLLYWQSPRLLPLLEGALLRTAVDDSGFCDRCAHRPVGQTILVEIDYIAGIEVRLVPVGSSVLHQLDEQFFAADPVPHQVLVGPGFGVSLGESPRLVIDETPQVFRERHSGIGFTHAQIRRIVERRTLPSVGPRCRELPHPSLRQPAYR